MTRRRRHRRAGLAATAALALAVAGCARATQVLPVQIDPEPAPVPVRLAVRGYDSAVRAIAHRMVELGLPLPGQLTVFVYPTRAEYERGLIDDGRLSATAAPRIATASLGLARHRRLFVNDEALRGSPRRAWLGLVAHELAHLAQYELAGGRRGRSEQWLREGMADWVATRILERLGEADVNTSRQRALHAVAAVDTDGHERIDLVALGHPRGWEAHRAAVGTAASYGLAFLLTDDLVRRNGFDAVMAYFRAFARTDDRFEHFRNAFGESLHEFERRALDRIRFEARGIPPAQECDAVGPPDSGLEVPPSAVVEGCDGSAVR